MLYAREEIPSKLVQIVYRKLNKKYFLEKIDLRREKWFLVCNCSIHKILIKRYLKYVSKEIDSLSTKYDNVIILVDLNSETTEEVMTTFCQIHNLKILMNEPTLYKKSNNPTYIALNMTNRPKNFQSQTRHAKNMRAKPKCSYNRETAGKIASLIVFFFFNVFPSKVFLAV